MVLFIAALDVGYQLVTALDRLEVVETERDRWQRPDAIIAALGLQPGRVVVDLGSGSGYFTLKLAAAVGNQGRVLAVDIRRLPLFFVRLRALLRGRHNIDTIVGTPDDPKLSPNAIDAVLIVNTYHELSDAPAILKHISLSLRSGGRLVIVDRSRNDEEQHHEIAREAVETDLTRNDFLILGRQDNFIAEAGSGIWWMIVARKP